MMTLDRRNPAMREALDRAARVAELMLEHHNGEAEQEFALDVLNFYVDGILTHMVGRRTNDPMLNPMRRLAWAFALTERRTNLQPHEEKLVELAWEKVKQDALDLEWERMGL